MAQRVWLAQGHRATWLWFKERSEKDLLLLLLLGRLAGLLELEGQLWSRVGNDIRIG